MLREFVCEDRKKLTGTGLGCLCFCVHKSYSLVDKTVLESGELSLKTAMSLARW